VAPPAGRDGEPTVGQVVVTTTHAIVNDPRGAPCGMASAIPITDGIAGEHRHRSGEFFTFTMGAAFKGAEPASSGCAERDSRSQGRNHHRSAGGDGRHR